MKSKKKLLEIALLLLLTFILGLVPYTFQVEINSDAAMYIWAAQSIEQGNWSEAKEFYPSIFLPVLISFFHIFVSDWFLAAQLVSLFFLTLLTLPFYGLVYYFYGREVARISTIFLALFPLLREKTVWVLRDAPFLFFFVLSLWLLLQAIDRKKWHYSFCSLLSAFLSSFSRVEGYLLLPVIFLFFIANSFRTDNKKELCFFLVAGGLGSFILFAFPQYFSRAEFIFRNSQMVWSQFEFIHVGKKLILLEPSFFIETTRHYILLIYFVGLLDELINTGFPPLFLLASLGFFISFREEKKKLYFFIPFLLLFLFIPYINMLWRDYSSSRYVLPFLILFYLWLGKGLLFLEEILQRHFSGIAWRKVLLFVFIFLCLFRFYDRVSAPGKNVVIPAGQWLEQEKKPSSIIFTNDIRINLYAQIPIKKIFQSKIYPFHKKELSERIKWSNFDLQQQVLQGEVFLFLLQKKKLSPPLPNVPLEKIFSEGKYSVYVYRFSSIEEVLALKK